MNKWSVLAVLLAAGLPGSPVGAQQDADDALGWEGSPDDDAVGFGGDGEADNASGDDQAGWGDTEGVGDVAALSPSSLVSFGGSFRSDWAAWVRRLKETPFAKGRQSLDLDFRFRHDWLRIVLGVHGMYDVAYQVDRSQYAAPALRTYEWLVRTRESYIAFSGEHIEFAIGAQKVALGAGELLSVLDVANPRDEREPGLTDLQDRRLPVLMSRLSLFWNAHRVELLATHEAFFRLRPPPLSFFSPFREIVFEAFDDVGLGAIARSFLLEDVDYQDERSRFDPRNTQGIARYTYAGSAVDVGVYAGSLIEYPGVAQWTPTTTALPLRIPLRHPRYTMVGASIAKPVNEWLFHAELATDINRAVQTQTRSGVLPVLDFERRHLVRWLLGVRYARLGGAVVTFEYAQGSGGQVYQNNYTDNALVPVNPATIAIRWAQPLFNDRHSAEVVGVSIGPRFRGGQLVRAQLTHKLVEDLFFTWGYAGYFPGKERSLIYGFERNDRAFLRFRWDFAVE